MAILLVCIYLKLILVHLQMRLETRVQNFCLSILHNRTDFIGSLLAKIP